MAPRAGFVPDRTRELWSAYCTRCTRCTLHLKIGEPKPKPIRVTKILWCSAVVAGAPFETQEWLTKGGPVTIAGAAHKICMTGEVDTKIEEV